MAPAAVRNSTVSPVSRLSWDKQQLGYSRKGPFLGLDPHAVLELGVEGTSGNSRAAVCILH